jgi:enoyl-CoA hydratase/carnithine racemase
VIGVDGAAIGIGTTMLLHADYVLASDESIFQTPFVDLGLVPEAASSLLIPELMGQRLAFELLVMGATWSPARAAEHGIVNHVVSSEALEGETLKAARAIAARPPEAVRLSRRLMRPPPERVSARIAEEAALFAKRLESREARETFAAFLARGKTR